MREFPKILIISHNLYDNSNNIGKTLTSLLQNWPKDRIAQLYFRNDQPTFKFCQNYYCITDRDILNYILSLKKNAVGRKVESEKLKTNSKTERTLYRVGNKRVPIVSFLRDVMWRSGVWKCRQLSDWIQTTAPDVILFVPNDYELAYEVCLYVRTLVEIPIVPYYMDDAFYYDCKTSFLDRYRRLRIRRRANEIHSFANCILTICEKMSHKYESVFGIPCEHYMNSIKPSAYYPKLIESKHVKMSYIGNLHSNRWKSLIEIGYAIKKINETFNWDIDIDVYTTTDLGIKELELLKNTSCINLKGSIAPNEVELYQRKSDILIHIEAFDEKSKNSTRYSLSTKIPEYLNSGVCIFAYGPEDIASIEYLLKHRLGFVACSTDQIEKTILNLLNNTDERVKMQMQGLRFVLEKHNEELVAHSFIEKLLKIAKESN